MTTAFERCSREELVVAAVSTMVEYKEGWSLYFSTESGCLAGHLSAHVPDSRRPRWVTFTDYWPVPEAISSVPALYDWLLDKFDEIEQHETREFFKVNGMLWDDPHAQGQPGRRGF